MEDLAHIAFFYSLVENAPPKPGIKQVNNAVRPHSALGGRTPDQIYFDQPLLAAA